MWMVLVELLKELQNEPVCNALFRPNYDSKLAFDWGHLNSINMNVILVTEEQYKNNNQPNQWNPETAYLSVSQEWCFTSKNIFYLITVC
jgi:hypothetical protein